MSRQSETLPLRRLLLAILFAVLAPAAVAEDWQTVESHWYAIDLEGEHAGWAHFILEKDGERFRSTSDQFLSIRRGPDDVVKAAMTVRYIEAADGTPERIELSRTLSNEEERRTWQFEGDSIAETTRQAGRERTRTLPKPAGTWLMPRAASEYESARRAAGVDTIRFRELEVDSGLRVVDVVMTRHGEEKATVDRRTIPVEVWRSERRHDGRITSTQTLWISEDDVLVRAEEQLGGLSLAMRLTSRTDATEGIGDGPEILVRTFVRPDRRIHGAHRTTSATYLLRLKDGDPPDLPSAGVQRVETTENGAVRVRLDLSSPVDADPDASTDETYLSSSPLVDTSDPVILEFVEHALDGVDGSASDRARALHEAVHRWVARKGLQSAFASASETVRSRAGDCSEHAVLLCAALRTEGIPARVASGLIYADSFVGQRHIFGWHMWTQALIDGRWIDLDATLPQPFSAAHILTGTSSLDDGALDDDLTSVVSLMGNLEIEVVDVGYEAAPR